eukprot:TRINITY_DN17764_c0_g1_i2.p1 TRINITY_DN17764_c0_g1~~TRINITY_DN17764_c0_g1_i2.p1  ORF type:complete len:343 (+),score=90.25 TRINITY_DN17764_c0_g1_i2:121-1149(+)
MPPQDGQGTRGSLEQQIAKKASGLLGTLDSWIDEDDSDDSEMSVGYRQAITATQIERCKQNLVLVRAMRDKLLKKGDGTAEGVARVQRYQKRCTEWDNLLNKYTLRGAELSLQAAPAQQVPGTPPSTSAPHGPKSPEPRIPPRQGMGPAVGTTGDAASQKIGDKRQERSGDAPQEPASKKRRQATFPPAPEDAKQRNPPSSYVSAPLVPPLRAPSQDSVPEGGDSFEGSLPSRRVHKGAKERQQAVQPPLGSPLLGGDAWSASDAQPGDAWSQGSSEVPVAVRKSSVKSLSSAKSRKGKKDIRGAAAAAAAAPGIKRSLRGSKAASGSSPGGDAGGWEPDEE